jgi:hypothetical protein
MPMQWCEWFESEKIEKYNAHAWVMGSIVKTAPQTAIVRSTKAWAIYKPVGRYRALLNHVHACQIINLALQETQSMSLQKKTLQ